MTTREHKDLSFQTFYLSAGSVIEQSIWGTPSLTYSIKWWWWYRQQGILYAQANMLYNLCYGSLRSAKRLGMGEA